MPSTMRQDIATWWGWSTAYNAAWQGVPQLLLVAGGMWAGVSKTSEGADPLRRAIPMTGRVGRLTEGGGLGRCYPHPESTHASRWLSLSIKRQARAGIRSTVRGGSGCSGLTRTRPGGHIPQVVNK